jgi:quercetin dioxygenase-like cupin family protein
MKDVGRMSERRSFVSSAMAACLMCLGCASRHGAATPEPSARGAARAAVIGASDGERRYLRGGTAPLLIKVDPHTTGSQHMVLGSSDLPPGDEIRLHRHLQEDEIIIITRGTGRVTLGRATYTAQPGAVVFIPQGTCIALANTGPDTLSNTFVFSSPGFERVLRAVSTAPGETPRMLTPEARAVAFHAGHAEAEPSTC